MPTQRRIERMREVLRNRQLDLTVVCENIHDPHNVSAILRTCDAVGVYRAHLLYTEEDFPKLGKKSSASAKKWVELERHRSYESLQERLKGEGFTIYATFVDPTAKSIFDIDWTAPSAVIMGNEHRGVSKEALQIADQAVYIPMFGMIRSLNVSVATAVILYEAVRQRLAKGRYPNPGLDESWLERELERWTKK